MVVSLNGVEDSIYIAKVLEITKDITAIIAVTDLDPNICNRIYPGGYTIDPYNTVLLQKVEITEFVEKYYNKAPKRLLSGLVSLDIGLTGYRVQDIEEHLKTQVFV